MPTSKNISSVASRTRGKVISATVALIYEVGLSGLTHRKIAERAGVPLGTTTYHFDSLTQLIELAIRQELDADAQRRQEVIACSRAGFDIVETLIALMVPGSSDKPQLLASAYERLSEIQFNRDFRHLVKEHQLAVESDISKLLELAGMEISHSNTVLALLDGFLLQWIIYEKSHSWLRSQLSKALMELGIKV